MSGNNNEIRVVIEVGPALQQLLLQVIYGSISKQEASMNKVESMRAQPMVQVDPSMVLGVIERFLTRASDTERRDEERNLKY
jgi:hypothetical protein